MKDKNEHAFILYIVLTIYAIITNIELNEISTDITSYIINPLFWIMLSIYSYIFLRDKYHRIKYKKDKLKLLIIILLTYLIIYFSSGLFLSYEESPYSHTILGILKNTWSIIVVDVLVEYVRYSLIKNTSNKKYRFILIAGIFSLLEIDFNLIFSNLGNIDVLMKYIFGFLIPILAKNSLLTYLNQVSGIISAIIYKVFLSLMVILLPIFPNTNWYIQGLLGVILPFIVGITTRGFIFKKKKVNTKRSYKKGLNIPLYLSIGILILFFYGVFSYRPIGIMSDSMKPEFKRGDAVIIENINEDNIDLIEVGSIIAYMLDNIVIVHRVVEIHSSEEEILYVTKGDNNNSIDSKLVSTEQIIGIVDFSIPYIGYPSILLQSLIEGNKDVGVET